MNEELKKQWLEQEKKRLNLIGSHIVPNNHHYGLFFRVNEIEIPENLFKEEFDEISRIYFSVIEKIKSHQA